MEQHSRPIPFRNVPSGIRTAPVPTLFCPDRSFNQERIPVMDFVISLLPHLPVMFGVGWRIAYLVIATLFVVEAWRALRAGHACRAKIAKAAAYLVITLKALLT
jgi:hypothetical protein